MGSMVEGSAMAGDGAWMTDRIRLGRSDLEVPRLGVGAMTWGSPSGRSRWGPAKLAYGGTPGPEEEQRAFEASLSAGVDLFDTAAMYSGGASERRLGELADGRHVVIATKFPPGWRSRAELLPEALDQSLARLRRSTVDLYQHHFPSRRIPIPALMGLMADAVEAGKVRAIGVSNYSAAQLRAAHAALAERGIPLASNQVEYSLLHRAPEVNGVLDACRELGVTLIAYQPLAMGPSPESIGQGIGPRGSDASAATTAVVVSRRPSRWWPCWVKSVSATPRLLRRWRCGGSSSRTACCRSLVRRTGGRRPAMPKRFPSRWLM
jgi:aryl-alcohol dehydrogenase-like predicted oxidoreductase